MIRSKGIVAIPPGATIKEQLLDRGMSQKEFSVRMGMSEKHISKLIHGEVQLTPDVAMRLEVVLGVPSRFWSNLEAIYREKIIKANAENALDADIEIAKLFPYNPMVRLGWIADAKTNIEKVENLRKFFEVVELTILGNEQIVRIACRRLAITDKSDLILMAFAQRARIIARDIETSPINIKALIEFIPQIREMTDECPEEFCPKLKKILSDCGIALVFLPHLQGSFLQGASFIDGNKIVIMITDRGKDADKFWFSLFHELAHVVLGHIGNMSGTTDADEEAADKWAEDKLISNDAFNEFKRNNNFTKRSIVEFSDEQGIAPGIVVGRLQSEHDIKYSEFNNLKKKIQLVI